MNKKRAAAVAAILSAALTVGCSGNQSVNFDKTYWDENPSATELVNVHEKLTYSVGFTKGTSAEDVGEYVPRTSGNENLSFTVGEGSSYVAELSVEDGLYVYKTVLTVNGVYTYSGGTKEISGDYTETTVKFKGIKDKFRPVETVKKARNTTPVSTAPSGDGSFITSGYELKITYGEKDATVEFKADDDSADIYRNQTGRSPYVIKNYGKKDYIDNETAVLVFRAFAYTETLSCSYRSIEPFKGVLETLQATTVSDSSGAQKKSEVILKSFMGANERKFTAQGVKFATQGSYGQPVLYAFYSVDGDTSSTKTYAAKRLPLLIYQPAIFNSGYFIYTLESVN
ncbi:MAG TPA: hypothetical protein DDW54_04790 [Clostridiales bacterium]|nr:hypothetical protein [Clostridiales bacterium]